MEIDKWISGYKVRIFPWVDKETIYCNVQYYRPGQSISQPPVWDKSVYITDDEKGRNFAYDCTDTLVNYVASLKIRDGQKLVITVQ